MQLLRTPRTDLPSSIIDRLALIKTVFMELHPEIPEAPIATMLNAALQPKYRKTSTQEFVSEVFHGLPANTQGSKKAFTRAGLKLTRAESAKSSPSHEALTSLCVAVLLQDGLHPMATLTGFHLNRVQADEMKESGALRLYGSDLFNWGADFEQTSPLLTPAIVILDTLEHAVLYDQHSIVEHHRRFAPMLSNKRDPLHAFWEETFAPKKDKLERHGAKVTRLTKALGAITETSPEYASDRVQNSDWAYIAKHLWAVSGYVAELGDVQDPEAFLKDTLKHPAQIEPSTISFLARTSGHPLREAMIERYAKHAMDLKKGSIIENRGLLLAATHCPELASLVGLGYEDIVQEAFGKHIADMDLETIDYALAPVSKAWGRVLPSKDVGLISTKICRHKGWIKAVEAQLPMAIAQHYEQVKSFPEGLRNGQIPPSFVPDDLIRPFAHQQMQRLMTKGFASHLIMLQKEGKLDARFIIQALTSTGANKNDSRLARAYHQGVVTLQQISAIYPSGLDKIIQADLGM
ncbi:hypothetical protein [Pseudomonas amygdali]|uniref:Uncharacterized protein n=2 Tax=Pseudomonas amygdali pv. lachrymans TaxID=53707 RepID=A0ABR5KSF1_PSEAV|nr:hypothetical protein [Pseudomonas amygdali]AXH60096.1 hypothetical protein PLA107_033330 [Pseudomonas amygdali pv. lachrymans str. M301315]KPC17502.1 Uncharacterized protein AC499_0704 [Pseudomonas amygdali pv. lachrymans]RMT06544.1 hypothetical protein ALP54_06421 [Pseudomonas amygdali pv. lachrymans]